MKRIILLLGAPNDDFGNLSKIALDRADCAFGIYSNNESIQLLCTGGCGKHFNTTNKPHFSSTFRL